MDYQLENEYLLVTAVTHGAELTSVVNKATSAQMLWSADPKVWNRHAPILFPYVGRLKEGKYQLDGKTFEGGSHGFARDSEFTATQVSATSITFRLDWNEDTLLKFPRKFRLEVNYTLDGKTIRQTTTVTNLDEKEMKFGLGYHPGFMIPFDDQHTTQDYELRFDTPQQPQEAIFDRCFMTDKSRPYGTKSQSIALNDRIFDNDSIFLQDLDAKTVSLYEKDTGRNVSIELKGFPYFVFWSSLNQEKLQFVCLEPWHSHPDMLDYDGDWEKKNCAAALKPQEQYVSHLNMTFNR